MRSARSEGHLDGLTVAGAQAELAALGRRVAELGAGGGEVVREKASGAPGWSWECP